MEFRPTTFQPTNFFARLLFCGGGGGEEGRFFSPRVESLATRLTFRTFLIKSSIVQDRRERGADITRNKIDEGRKFAESKYRKCVAFLRVIICARLSIGGSRLMLKTDVDAT